MEIDKNILYCITALAVILIVLYIMGFFEEKPNVENYNGTFNPAPLEDVVEMVAVNDGPGEHYNENLSRTQYAELGDAGVSNMEILGEEGEIVSPMERLDTLQDSYVPHNSNKTLPFSYDAAKPLTFYTSGNLPRTFLKGKLYEMDVSHAVRGNVDIKRHEAPRWAGQYDYLDAGGSAGSGLYTGSPGDEHSRLGRFEFNSIPMQKSGAGHASQGNGGMKVDVIMDL